MRKIRKASSLVPSAQQPVLALRERAISSPSPIEERAGFLFKREDLYRPIEGSPINGSKLRQCLSILHAKPSAGVVTFGSIYSPQIAIVACCARVLRRHCIVVIAGDKVTRSVELCGEYGAEIITCKSARHAALRRCARDLARLRRFNLIEFGMKGTEDNDNIPFDTVSSLGKIPSSLGAIVVTCGSGVTAQQLMRCCIIGKVWPKRFIVISTGPNRRASLSEHLHHESGALSASKLPWEYYSLSDQPSFRYERNEPFTLGGIALHPQYEAKTFRWALAALSPLPRRTLFWIIGSEI